jgi:hypothetical protein
MKRLQAEDRQMRTRKKCSRKRSLYVINEHFEAIFDKIIVGKIRFVNRMKHNERCIICFKWA